MDGDNKPQTSSSGRSDSRSDGPDYNPNNRTDHPPSLSEPAPAKRSSLPAPASVTETAAEPEPVSVSDSGGFYHPESSADTSFNGQAFDDQPKAKPAPADQSVSWVSSGEELQGQAGSWRVKMSLIGVILGALVFLITRDWVSTGSVFFAGLLFGFLGARKPRPLSYSIDSRGITIGQKRYGFGEFRAFWVANDGTPVISLIPLKRFLPLLSVRFDPKQADGIISLLAAHLPMEAPRRDAIDHITHRIRI